MSASVFAHGERRRTLEVELGSRPLDRKSLANLHLMNILRHLVLVVLLDEESELAGLARGRDGGVGADDGLALGVKKGALAVGRGLDDDT